MDLYLELAKFNHIKFYEEPHEYFIDGAKQKSVTTFIGEFETPFDEDYWSERKAAELGLTKEELLKEWAFKRDVACDKGSCFHAYAENYLNNKIFPWEPEKYAEKYGRDVLSKPLKKLREMFHQFYKDSSRNLVPVKSELVVGDRELGICGMVDQLYYNKKSEKLEIWDWKTNKEITFRNKFQRFNSPIDKLEVCKFNTYSLQLSMYKYIIEKNTDIELGECYLVWFFEENDTYQCIKCKDFRQEITKMLAARCSSAQHATMFD